ncbi:adaptin N terminal region-domain-containing protein [Fomitopsis serialis]|uniref:adaptin N terminal region-domain-containing protein n=1 Tax=Fomitopsis serialis TaxID=139415 RepID=UPI002007A90E|nr:adaptin N terminal region-domain-containing protein [Neoantrodia serialis]KAH9930143.1 adaptin N terminal region-domain-containing protein [Neoantrodia serialis]
MDFNSLAENASRLGARLQETLSEQTRDLNIARASSSAYLDNPEDKVRNIKKQLDSNSDREKLEAMKRLIALISKGRNVSEFFPQVVKNVASHNIEVRKLVYIYLLRYAEHEPETALLSINTFQKDLSDSSPLIRAMALRLLSGLNMPVIASILVIAIKKAASDISPYVRKAAALALPKCYNLDPSHQPELIQVLTNLLRDRSPLSIGSVAAAFTAVCPTRLDLLHPHYRRLCRTIIDADEWGQVDLLNLLTRYARTMLARPTEEVDADLRLLLNSAEPLFQSQNPAVGCIGCCQSFYYLAPQSEVPKIVLPLLRLLHASREAERVVLAYLLIAARTLSHAIAPHYARCLVRADDVRQTKVAKVRLLRALITPETHPALLREFTAYAEDADDALVADSIQAIGYCARIVPEATQHCLSALMGFIQSKHDSIVANAVIVLKSLVQIRLQQQQYVPVNGDPTTSPLSIIARLAWRIDEIRHRRHALRAERRAGERVGKGIEGIAEWAPDVLRKSVKVFMEQPPMVKLQTLTLAAKLLVLSPTNRTLALLTRHALALARYDQSVDVRDRGRMLSALLVGVDASIASPWRTAGVRMILFSGKLGVAEDISRHDDDRLPFGTLSAVTGKESLESHLPDWLEEGTESSLRDSEEDMPTAPVITQISSQASVARPISARATPVVLSASDSRASSFSRQNGTKSNWADLDKFYEDANEEEEETESEESEDESEEEDESGEEEEESEAEDESDDGRIHR